VFALCLCVLCDGDGACAVTSCAQDGSTALMDAAEKGRSDCMRLLLDAGADKDAKYKVRAAL
jgi:hypothetical protein